MTQKLVTSAPAQVRAVSGRPETAATLMEVWQGLSAAVVRQAEVPVLGVCLGMQALAHAAGARERQGVRGPLLGEGGLAHELAAADDRVMVQIGTAVRAAMRSLSTSPGRGR